MSDYYVEMHLREEEHWERVEELFLQSESYYEAFDNWCELNDADVETSVEAFYLAQDEFYNRPEYYAALMDFEAYLSELEDR